MKQYHGFGYVFQPTYKDKRSGGYSIAGMGKSFESPAQSTKERNSWKLLSQRHGEIAADIPTGPAETSTGDGQQ
jgi:hypothetical protein